MKNVIYGRREVFWTNKKEKKILRNTETIKE